MSARRLERRWQRATHSNATGSGSFHLHTKTPHEQRTSCAASKTSVTGVTAIDDHGDLAGFLMGFDATPDPVPPMARYTPERSSLHLVAGHAVA